MDPEKGAQDVLRCDVCSDKEREKSPAEVHCNTCHTNVCGPCVVKHMTLNKSKKHDIVLLHSANTEVDLPNCASHSTVKCELFCKKCTIPICLKCLSSTHNSHAVEEIIDMCKTIRADIQKNAGNLKTEIIPKFKKLLIDEDEKTKHLMQAYDIFESSIEDHGKEIHKAVNDVITKYKAKVKQMKQTDFEILQQQKEDLNGLLSEAKKEDIRNDLLKRSRNVTELMAFKAKPINTPVLKNIIPPVFKPKPISDDVLESFFPPIPNSKVVVEEGTASLDEKKKLAAIGASTDEVLFTFKTPYKQLLRVACEQSGRLWTSGNESILRCLDMQNGSVIKSCTIPMNPTDICTNFFDDFFVSDGKTLYRETGGNLKKYYYAPDGWSVEAMAKSLVPGSIFFIGTNAIHLLLFLRREDNRQSKVVKVISAAWTPTEFQYDNEGKDLYNSNCYDFFLEENRNGDICVSDTTALVVIDKRGKFRFRYHGKVFDTFDKPFKPMGVTTDPRGNILLADLDNRCIHLLDQDGNFVRYITCGGSLDKIIDVSCDENGRVWVAERDTAKVKCIKYQ
uniref:LOW QUALITY PROTEIN: uncharacterized protein LOC111138381 n=1 Tax=Crassostrea virginica TaxID=6565 RepID=A0A8B8F131_CRAVI|nr:LOW QUALITY PROTEIN: uncharacterized protein LOC111138381 [Crassostrea virginica]